MVINTKYYVITIAAIFFALGIGIFMGFNMNGQDIYLRQQEILIQSLENRFNDYRVEREGLQRKIQELTTKNERYDKVINHFYSSIVQDQLADLQVVVIQTMPHYFYGSVREMIEEGGGIVPFQITYSDEFLHLSREQLEEINQLYGLNVEDISSFFTITNENVVELVVSGYLPPLLDYLITEEFIRLDNYYTGAWTDYFADYVVLAGGSLEPDNKKLEQVNLGLINRLKENNISIVGVERMDVAYSYIPFFKKNNVSTVDNIDTKIGQMALVYILNGIKGHFGEKETADGLLPNEMYILGGRKFFE